jgi:hypothetical protein
VSSQDTKKGNSAHSDQGKFVEGVSKVKNLKTRGFSPGEKSKKDVPNRGAEHAEA